MPSMRFVSPERWWRAVAAPLVAGWLGYGLSRSGAGVVGIILCWLVVAAGLCLAVLVMRTHLTVSDMGLADHRIFRVVRVPWRQIAGFEVNRPGSVWGGYCVTVACRDGGRLTCCPPGRTRGFPPPGISMRCTGSAGVLKKPR